MVFAIVGTVLLLLFLLWKLRYRYPPPDIPQALCYHKLSTKFCFEGTWMTPRRFLGQLDRLVDKGHSFIGEDEFLAALDDPSALHANKILLTFDDGYEALCDTYTGELARRGVPVLVFLPADYVGRENTWDLSLGRRPFRHLSWPQVEEMAAAGARFGAHGASHADLTAQAASALEREIVGAKRAIEARVGRPVRCFSYPFGRYNRTVRALVERAGYSAAFSLYPPHCNEQVDRFALRRNGVYIIDTSWSVGCKLKPNPLFWFEEMKCRTINGVAVLTPFLKRFSTGPGR